MSKYFNQGLLGLLFLTFIASVQAEVVIEGTLRTLNAEEEGRTLNVVPGQVVRMDWQLGSDAWFTKPPLMPRWQAEGAVILPSDEEEGNFSRRSGRTTISGVNRYYWVVPEQPGVIHIAPHEIWLNRAFATEAERHKTHGLTLRVSYPESHSSSGHFFPASDVEINQFLSSTEALSVGDQVVREITLFAGATLGSQIPPMDAVQSTKGIQGYLASVSVSNNTVSRGQLAGGQRHETWVYQLDQEGEIILPPIEVEWWDLEHKEYRSKVLPGVELDVIHAQPAGEEDVLRRSRSTVSDILSVIALIVVIGAIWYIRLRVIEVSTVVYSMVVTSHAWIDFLLLFTALFGKKASVQKRYLQWKRLNPVSENQQLLPDSYELLLCSKWSIFSQMRRLVIMRYTQRWQNKHRRRLPGLNG